MKKIILTTAVVLFGLSLLSSCDLTDDQIKELEKYGYSQTRSGDGDINHDEVGDDDDDDQQEGDGR